FLPDRLPKGFFVDRQRNARSAALVYYLDYDVLATAEDLGFRVVARPTYSPPAGPPTDVFAGYRAAEYRFKGSDFKRFIRPNETVYIDVVLERVVDRETMRLEAVPDGGRGSFKKTEPKEPIS